jgi:hypothetical protein
MIDIEQAHLIRAEPGKSACIKRAHGAAERTLRFKNTTARLVKLAFHQPAPS